MEQKVKEIRVKPCGCTEPKLSGWQTCFINIPLSTTLCCKSCGVKVVRPTMKMAVKAWNRRVKDGQRETDN